jgi:hypothetical protein
MPVNKRDLNRVGRLLKQLRDPGFIGDKAAIFDQLEGLGLSMGGRFEQDLERATEAFRLQSASFDSVFNAVTGADDMDIDKDEIDEVAAQAQAEANAEFADRLDEASRRRHSVPLSLSPEQQRDFIAPLDKPTSTPSSPRSEKEELDEFVAELEREFSEELEPYYANLKKRYPDDLNMTDEEREEYEAELAELMASDDSESELAKFAKFAEQLTPPKDSVVVVAKTVITPPPVVKEPSSVKSQELSEHVPSFFDSLIKVAQDFFTAVVRLFGFLAQEPAVSKGKVEDKASASGDAYQEYISSHASMRQSLGSGTEPPVVHVGLVSDEFITASRVDAVKPQADAGPGIELTSYPRSTKPEVSSEVEGEQDGLHKGP